jgi:hypothetical protein
VLTEEKLDETVFRGDIYKKILASVAQDWLVSASSPRRATKLLHSHPYGTKVVYKFYDTASDVALSRVNWYVEGVHAGEIEFMLLFNDEARPHLLGYVTSETNRYWSA